ncbi:enolase C-terminal domain-like protein [Polycladidibacter stylochi]|uniref:enolase C-terminal domain-like protein n=1 Tax=Polycladidibacter stylochi TaxID=1807766 RepID=UPI0008377D64|nr:enolase C-terminal domain-like protein [Pseudovibrio stylochi]
MLTIEKTRSILLSAPYGAEGSAENLLHLPQDQRICSMVEITLSDGTTGLGEGYLGVFAPEVFLSITDLVAQNIQGCSLDEGIAPIVRKARTVCGYWSLQGAAQHVVSAFEVALVDALSKHSQIPAVELFGGTKVKSIEMYGSGGDSLHPRFMRKELDELHKRGIKTIKIRARHDNIAKTVWTINEAAKYGIKVAVDMTQNLVMEGQTAQNVIDFCKTIEKLTGQQLVFIEECLGLDKLDQLPNLTKIEGINVAGGEIVTTKEELLERIERKYYDIVQPDASVLGGIQSTIDVCNYAQQNSVRPVVHSWGGPVCMMANYVAAFATGCDLIEYPMPPFALRQAMCDFESRIKNGYFHLKDDIGLGVSLTPEIEQKYAYDPATVYHCMPSDASLQQLSQSQKNWE